jgi:hypothetical protein
MVTKLCFGGVPEVAARCGWHQGACVPSKPSAGVDDGFSCLGSQLMAAFANISGTVDYLQSHLCLYVPLVLPFWQPVLT